MGKKLSGFVRLGIILAAILVGWWFYFNASNRFSSETGPHVVQDVDSEGLKALLFSGKPGILAFYTNSCPWCAKLDPELLEVQTLHGEELSVARMNAEKYSKEAATYKIKGVPTLVFYEKDGNPKLVLPGYRTHEDIIHLLKEIGFIQ